MRARLEILLFSFILFVSNSFAQGTYTLLYSFSGGAEGQQPAGALTEVKPGVFFGTASDVFEVTSSGQFRELSPVVDQDSVGGTLFPASDGYLYSSLGPIVAVNSSGKLNYLVPNFEGLGDLIEANNGQLYGIYHTGKEIPGPYEFFSLTPAGTLTNLYGGFPTSPLMGGLTQAIDGNFYGTDYVAEPSYVQIFKLTVNGTYSLLYKGLQASDGQLPNGQLVEAGNVLFGSTIYGGADTGSLELLCCGVVFSVDLNGNYKTIYTFQNGSDGASPTNVILASDGFLYGQSTTGENQVQLFRVSQDGSSFSIVAKYPAGAPAGILTEGSDGKLYGTTSGGGANGIGSIFSVDVGLTAPLPTVASIKPEAGAVGTQVLIHGTQLLGLKGVSFDGIPATQIESRGVDYAYAVVPAGAKTGPLTITTRSGSVLTKEIFTVQ